ncbi:kinase-like protein [Panus rudis PR-1116 ss-1]|nr:kinase-like protein [Panus rudis PR-1116 ss-1]
MDTPRPSSVSLSKEQRYTLRCLLIALSKASRTLPYSLFTIKGKTVCRDRNPFNGGGFADVFRAEYDDQPVVLKLRVFTSRPDDNKRAFEVSLVWQRLSHRYILPFLGVERNVFYPHYAIMSPWAENGNIVEYIALLRKRKERPPISEWMSQIASGLEYLHDECIVHGDLRGANILINEDLEVQLADFGLSRIAQNNSYESLGSRQGGTVRWMPPEVLKGAASTFASDVYSFGCTWLEIVTGKPPFARIKHQYQVMEQVMRGIPPPWDFADDGPVSRRWRFIRSCWNIDPASRPRAAKLTKECLHLIYDFGSGDRDDFPILPTSPAVIRSIALDSLSLRFLNNGIFAQNVSSGRFSTAC